MALIITILGWIIRLWQVSYKMYGRNVFDSHHVFHDVHLSSSLSVCSQDSSKSCPISWLSRRTWSLWRKIRVRRHLDLKTTGFPCSQSRIAGSNRGTALGSVCRCCHCTFEAYEPPLANTAHRKTVKQGIKLKFRSDHLDYFEISQNSFLEFILNNNALNE